jgi:hypothetical protein
MTLAPVAIGCETGPEIRLAYWFTVIVEQSGFELSRYAMPVAVNLGAQPSEVEGGANVPELALANCPGHGLDVAAGYRHAKPFCTSVCIYEPTWRFLSDRRQACLD